MPWKHNEISRVSEISVTSVNHSVVKNGKYVTQQENRFSEYVDNDKQKDHK